MDSTNPIEVILAAKEAALARLKARFEAAATAADKDKAAAVRAATTEYDEAIKAGQAEFKAALTRMVEQINAARNAAFQTARQTRQAQLDSAQQTRDSVVGAANFLLDRGRAQVESAWSEFCATIASCLTDQPARTGEATPPAADASTAIEARLQQIGTDATFEFTVVLSGASQVTDELATALHEAGCNDATLWSRDGKVGLDFSREAATLQEAIASAKSAIEQSRASVSVEEVCVDHGRR
jgi:hypothetical protein